jgi:hypothetical protein
MNGTANSVSLRWYFCLCSQAHKHMPDGTTMVIKVPRADWQFVTPGMHRG